ncbi:MAG: D-glycero-beta-D-manno-heptose 1-phosphate adenylyltransferase [Gemmatimonadetes bacterium]|nr:D-glycero-beta-D-manno-heptose 1-phosphate adenylyltransferase [Gemmatimonadota bacterium]
MPREEVLHRFGGARCGRIVFTNGVFDILHRGHVEYLYAARALGDALVVGINTDASARRLGKGSGRPVNGEADRAFVLAGLGCVDAVTLFGEDTPRELVAALLPDVLVKGGDYTVESVAGGAEVIAAGGRVQIIPLTPGRSTSSILQRARRGGEDG